MATYPLPRVIEDIFNIQNFLSTPYNNTSYAVNYAQLTISNTFLSINTFLSNVYIKATLFVTNLNVSNLNVTNTFLGYNISTFEGIIAPIQAQFDSITTGGNVTINSTVSVAETITVSAGIPALVENIGTNINANLKFSIPQGPQGIQVATGSTGATGPQGIQGVTGATGPQGIQGITGATGATGPQGVQGIQGVTGATGKDAAQPTFSIGTVTSASNPSVTIGGTQTNPVLNFGFVKGDTGEKGNQGDQGPQGDRGEKGDRGPQGAAADTTALAAATTVAGAAATAAGASAVAAATSAGAAATSATAAAASAASVEGKLIFFDANLIQRKEVCKATLTVTNGVYDTVILHPTNQSEFANDVLVDSNIISKGKIINYNVNGDNKSLNLESANDLNITSTNNDVNLRGGNQIVLNTPKTIVNNDLCSTTLKPIAANDTLTISHNNVICQNTFTTNTLSGITTGQTTSNLTITHPNVIIGNALKVDTINPILTTDDLTLSHNKIKIPNYLYTDHIYPFNSTTNELILHHIKVTVPNDLQVSAIIPLSDSLNNELSIHGTKIIIGTNSSDIYMYGKIHFMNATGDQDFFNEVDGFLNQSGI